MLRGRRQQIGVRVQGARDAVLDVLEATGSFVIWFDAGGFVLRATRAAVNILGTEPEDLVGWARSDLIHPDDQIAAVFPVPPVLGAEGAEPLRRILRFRHADGSWRFLESLPVDARSDDRVGAFVALLRDVTVPVLVRHVSATVQSHKGLAPAFAAVAGHLGEVLPHQTAMLSVITAEGLRVRAVHGTSQARAHLDRFVPLDEQARAEVAQMTGILHCRDTHLRTDDPFAAAIAPARAYAVFPIRVGGDLVATVSLFSRTPGLDGEARLALVADVVDQTGGLLFLLADLARQHALSSQLRDSARAALAEARTDPLTGLANRRAWEEGLDELITRARVEASPLSVVMLDLDGLKAVNDAQGHQAGDTLLRALGHAWRTQVRPGDLFARYGGDEFALALWGCPAGNAAEVVSGLAERLPEGCSVSAGIAAWDTRESSERLLGRADGALYIAKANGRGLTVLAGEHLGDQGHVTEAEAEILHLPLTRRAGH